MMKLAFLGLLSLSLHAQESRLRDGASADIPSSRAVSAEQRRALEMLDAAGPSGCPGGMLTEISVEVLATLLSDGLAVAVLDSSDTELVRLTITNTGRRALEQRCALDMIASGGVRGVPETVLVAYGFGADILTGLVRTGLAQAIRENVQSEDRSFELALIAITDDGRQALVRDR